MYPNFVIKLVAMATSREKIERGLDPSQSRKYPSFDEKMLKISPVDPEIIVLKLSLKNKEINRSKI